MEEINLKDLFDFFVKKIPVMLLITAIIFTMGVVYTVFFKTPLYDANTTLILVKKETNTSGDGMSVTQNDILLNQKLVSTYSEIIKSRRVLNQVVRKLSLNSSTAALSNQVTVSSVSDTEIIKIRVSDEDAELAAKIADTVADVFKKEVMDIYNLENVSIIDSAEVSDSPYNVQLMKDIIIYLAIGLIVSAGSMFVVYYFDTSVKSVEEIEKRLGVPVIGTIPLYKKGVK